MQLNRLLAVVALTVASCASTAEHTHGGVRTISSSACGVAFTIQPGWQADDSGRDLIILRRGPWHNGAATHSIQILCGQGEFETGASTIGFEKLGEVWTLNLQNGRSTDVDQAFTPSRGLRGDAIGRCFEPETRVIAACDQSAAYKWTPTGWIGAIGYETVLVNQIVASAKWLDAPN